MIISFVNCHNVAHGDIVKLLIDKKKSRIINLITVSASIPVVIYMKDSEENNGIALTIIASLQEICTKILFIFPFPLIPWQIST